MRRSRRSWLAVGSMTLILTAIALLQFSAPNVAPTFAQATQTVRATPTEGLEVARSLSAAFEHVADVARPVVVSVVSTSRVQTRAIQNPFGGNGRSPLEEFFGRDFFDRFGQGGDPGDQLRQGQGSGVIVSEDGYILTNNHVVQDADEVRVRLNDEREFAAKIIGTDPKTDVAVLKIEAQGLEAARLGDSDALRVGEWVVAAGNPFGLTASVTSGIVSAKGRANMGITDYEDFIQTDAAINPGNSGGALLNLDGEVVGINTAIMTRSGGSMGVGFAIPINMARTIMDSLIKDGRVVRGWLGVGIQPLTPDMARTFGYDGEAGVLIAQVTDHTPAAEAGLRSGDIVVAYDGRPVETMQRFRADVAATRPGQKVRLEIFRDGRFDEVDVKIGELEGDAVVARDAQSEGLDLGITARELTPQTARELGVDEDLHGVVITQVDPLSTAGRAGLRPGDVILDVQGRAVTNLKEFRAALGRLDEAKGIRLSIARGGAKLFVLLENVS